MKNTEKKLMKSQWKDTTRKKREIVGTHPCKLCGKIKEFTTPAGYKKGKNSLCRSCANSISGGGRGFVRPIDGKRMCGSCNLILSEQNFTLYKDGRRHSYCDPCKSEKFKQYQKNTGRFKRHGITKQIYEDMCNEQENKCYICHKTTHQLHIDHDHATGKVRKLLCKECNMALGLVRENLTTLNNMINYLEEH